MKYILVFMAATLLAPPVFAGHKEESKLAGSKLYIAKMEGDLDGFLAAEIVKVKLPVTVVLDETAADYVLSGVSLKEDDKWYHVVFGGKDKNEGNVRLLCVKDKTMVWAGEAGDRSLWWGGLKRGGQRKVAERIVKQLKKDLFE
jgi:hypothetical protein